MPDTAIRLDLLLIAALVLGGSVLGLIGILSVASLPRRLWRWTTLTALVGFAALSLLAAWRDLGRSAWLLPLLMCLGCCGCYLACYGHRLRFLHAAVIFLKNPRVQGAALLAASVCAGACLAWTTQQKILTTEISIGCTVPETRPVINKFGMTDTGREVLLSRAPFIRVPTVGMRCYEEDCLKRKNIAQRAIRLAPADVAYNCHGWIFAAGRYFVSDEFVEAILVDNGYTQVAVPQAHDLAIYRDDKGLINHSGVVRLAGEAGLVLIESKWGWLGRYLHTPEAQPYSEHCSYYRSERRGHLLQLGHVDISTLTSHRSE